MVNKNTVQIYRPSGSVTYMARVPRIIILGYCLIWEKKFEGTREECVDYCQKEFDIPWWKWPWNFDKLIYGNSIF